MARIKDVDPATMNSEELTTAFKTQLEQWGTVTNFFKVMGHSPASLNLWVTVDRDLRLKYADTDPDFLKIEQMVIMRTSTINNGTYCLSHNIDVALESGLSQGQIDAVTGDFEFSELLSVRQKIAVRWADRVTRLQAGKDDQLFIEMSRNFSEQQIVELTVLVGMWNFSNRFCDALHIEVEPKGKGISLRHK